MFSGKRIEAQIKNIQNTTIPTILSSQSDIYLLLNEIITTQKEYNKLITEINTNQNENNKLITEINTKQNELIQLINKKEPEQNYNNELKEIKEYINKFYNSLEHLKININQLNENSTIQTNELKYNHVQFNGKFNKMYDDLIEKFESNDTKNLRHDLNNVLAGIKNELKNDVTLLINSFNKKTDKLFFDNEVIKHHILLEETLKTYIDKIESLKNNIKKVLSEL